MKIIILRLNTGDFGKIGTYNVQEIGLANALMRMGHDVKVFFLHRTCDKITQDDCYPFVYYLPHKRFGLHGIFNVEMLKSYEPEKIILFSDNQLWAKNVILWCKKNNVQCVQYFGAVLSDNPGFLHQFYTKLILKRNIGSYHYSKNVAKTLKVQKEMERLNIPCTKVINIGLDRDLLHENINPDYVLRNELGYYRDQKVLLFIGRMVDYKKPFMACDIVKELNKEKNQYRLIMIGKGVLQEPLKKYIKDNDLEYAVRCIERVPYREIYKYMVACDCLINLSSIEIFGMTILEAMYYSLPVIAHTAPGPNDIIKNNDTGILCDTDDVKEWCRLIKCALTQKELYGERSRNAIKKYFLWDSIAADFLTL